MSYFYLGDNHCHNFRALGDANGKYNVAMDLVSYAVGYNLSPFFIAYICLHSGKLAP